MSQLTISTRTRSYKMNVVAFSSPVYGSIASAQTRTEAIHFPIKITEPEIQFDVVFRNQDIFEDFQKFVRRHQQSVLTTTLPMTLSWPERDINNWTGVIKEFVAGGARFNYLPRARFTVELIDSAVSTRTDIASVAANWQTIFGLFGPLGSVLRPPTVEEVALVASQTGQNLLDGGRYTPPGTPAPSGSTPLAPTVPGGGIVTGS